MYCGQSRWINDDRRGGAWKPERKHFHACLVGILGHGHDHGTSHPPGWLFGLDWWLPKREHPEFPYDIGQ